MSQDQDAIHGGIGLPQALHGNAGVQDLAILADEALVRDVPADNAPNICLKWEA